MTIVHVIESTVGTCAAMVLYQGARRVAAAVVWAYFKKRISFVGKGGRIRGGDATRPGGR